ncbi:MAG: helix-turn-helix domain-containing protein [Firmicutes bacterium]|nr:helix-turn-helix domain-containing protein [Bacillota bacterium]
MRFAERLKELRIEESLTQYKLAQILRVDKTTIRNWEKGTNETDFATLMKLAKFFEVTTDYLLGMTDY